MLGDRGLWGSGGFRAPLGLGATCDPKPYKIVGYDPLIREANP